MIDGVVGVPEAAIADDHVFAMLKNDVFAAVVANDATGLVLDVIRVEGSSSSWNPIFLP